MIWRKPREIRKEDSQSIRRSNMGREGLKVVHTNAGGRAVKLKSWNSEIA